MTSKLKEGVMQVVFTLCACVSILAVALICIFLFANGVPTLFKIGPMQFLLGTTWKPGNDIFGILPMILGSIYVTAGAILVGVPIGLLTAIYMSRFASPAINRVMLPAVQLLAGIPSVVYGFFGMIVLVPAPAVTTGRQHSSHSTLNTTRSPGCAIARKSGLLFPSSLMIDSAKKLCPQPAGATGTRYYRSC